MLMADVSSGSGSRGKGWEKGDSHEGAGVGWLLIIEKQWQRKQQCHLAESACPTPALPACLPERGLRLG